MNIVIVDYGMGNIRSIQSTLKYLGVDQVSVSANYDTLNNSDKIILPGVGSFGKAMSRIRERELDKILNDLVIENGKPLLGICLGMQLLGKSSTEDGMNEGLGFVDADVIKFDNTHIKVPHVGINQVHVNHACKIYEGFKEEPDFYFVHSYKMVSDKEINQSMCEYGGEFIASFEQNNIAGVQFHPELSQNNGLFLLKNFIQKL